jgi:hypothetical protein
MFNECVRQEWVPQGLLDGQITMLPKPNKPDYATESAYRTITVLNAMRKVSEQVGGARIMSHLERHHRLGEEQAAYREGRACVDHLFTLAELQRAKMHPNCWCSSGDGVLRHAFSKPADWVADPAKVMPDVQHQHRMDGHSRIVMLDLSTAFDLVDWSCLFDRLHAAGVTGATAKLLRAMYRHQRCRVKVGRARSRWVRPQRGVFQGGVTSPPLFSVYMTLVAAEVRKALRTRRVHLNEPLDMNSWPTVEGVDMSAPHVVYSGPLALLLLADDLTIFAQTDADMDLCVRAVVKAVHLLGGKINPDKSVQLVTRDGVGRQVRWYKVQQEALVEDGAVPQALEHKYLGVWVGADMNFADHRRAVHAATRSALGRVGAETMTYGVYDPRLAAQTLHHAYSVLLYAAEVWSSVTLRGGEAEKTLVALAHCAARALQVDTRTARDFLLGELGFVSPAAKLAAARLAYWCELLVQPPHRYTRHAYLLSAATYAGGDGNAGGHTVTWAGEIRQLLQAMHHAIAGGAPTEQSAALADTIAGAWAGGDVGRQREWLSAAMVARHGDPLPPATTMTVVEEYWATRTAVRKFAEGLVADWAQECWRASVASHSSLRWYAYLQPNLVLAQHLNSTSDLEALKLRVELRGNVYPLAAVRGRWGTAAGTPQRAEAVSCKVCGGPDEENLPHFLLRCPALAHARGDLPAVFQGVCKHPAVLAVIPGQVPAPEEPGERVLLALLLGGDLTHHAGLAQFMLSAGQVRRDDHDGRHPAQDRLAALRAGGRVLRALHRARGQVLGSRPSAQGGAAADPAQAAMPRAALGVGAGSPVL